jgi:thiopeptide-type bacteriocin biosynthesis protein
MFQRQLIRECLQSIGAALPVDERDMMPIPADARSTADDRSSYTWVDYAPEIDRYGGLRAIAIAENVFFASSVVALRALTSMPVMRRDTRLGLALYTILATFLAISSNRERVAEMLSQYAGGIARRLFPAEQARRSWLRLTDSYFDSNSLLLSRQSARIADAVESSGDDDPMLDYSKALRAAYSKLRSLEDEGALCFGDGGVRFPGSDSSLARVGCSYSHMTCNRLGVTLHEEARAALVASYSLRGGRRQ